MNFERPLVTDMNVAGQRFNGIKHGWASAHNEEDSMEVSKNNIFLVVLLNTYAAFFYDVSNMDFDYR